MSKEYSASQLEAMRSISHPKEWIGPKYSGSEGKTFDTRREFEKHVDEHNLIVDPNIHAGSGNSAVSVYKYDKSLKKVVRVK